MESNIQQDMNALIKRRHEELEELQKGNHETYAYSYDVTHHSKNIKDNFYKNSEIYKLLISIDGIAEGRAKKILNNIQIYDLVEAILSKNFQKLISIKDVGEFIASKLIENREKFCSTTPIMKLTKMFQSPEELWQSAEWEKPLSQLFKIKKGRFKFI